MDFNQLNCFIAVAQHLNFTQASNSLFLTQSTVSHNIAELEKELGAKLFNRSKSAVSLTVAGKLLLENALVLDSTLRKTISMGKQIAQGSVGELTVGFVFEPIAEHQIDSFKRFRKKHPGIDITFLACDSASMSREILNHKLDIGFCRYITLSDRKELVWKHLYFDPLLVVLACDHPLAAESELTLAQIVDEVIILMNRLENPGMFDMVHHMFLSGGYSPTINDTTNDLLTTIMMARLNMGVVLLPAQFQFLQTDDLRWIPLLGEDAFHDIGVAWSKQNNNPSLQLFLDELFMKTGSAV